MDSYQSKIDAATALIEKHNAAAANKIEVAKFVECIKNNGGTTDDALKLSSWEDLIECGLPKLLARQVAEVFRKAPVEAKSETPTKFVSEKKAAAMTFRELVERYDPVEHDNPVGKRLAEISKGQPCIAFDANGNVLVEASSKEVKHLRDGFDPRESVTVDGLPVRLYRVGERPGNFLEENPLYPGRPLRDGECDQTGRSWEGVSDVIRALLFLAVTDTREVAIDQLKDAHDILDLAVRSDAEKTIRGRFRKTSLRYDELKAEGKLPTLKIARGGTVRKQNPFGVNRTY